MPISRRSVSPRQTCTNPGGGTQPPGQNPVEVSLSGTQAIPADAWTAAISDVAFSSAHIVVRQNGGVVLDVTCTFSPSIANGDVPSKNVTCS